MQYDACPTLMYGNSFCWTHKFDHCLNKSKEQAENNMTITNFTKDKTAVSFINRFLCSGEGVLVQSL